MTVELKREFYKFRYLHLIKYSILAVLALTFYGALPTRFVTINDIANGFGIFQWIIVIMIGVSAESLAFEFRFHTIVPAVYKSARQADLYFAKLIILISYSIFLTIIGFLMVLLVKTMLFGKRYALLTTIYHHHHLLSLLVVNAFGALIYTLFIITLGLLLFILFRNSAVVIVIGIFLAFMGDWISSGIMTSFPGIDKIWAWNPLNMINVVTQLGNQVVSKTVLLNAHQLMIGTLMYALMFALFGILAFKKKSI